MIDKLELRLPALTPLHPEVREFIAESRHFESSSRTMRSGRYEWVTDLRPVRRDALLHYSLKREEGDPHQGEHKLELLDAGEKGYSELVSQIESAVTCAINDLEIMRVDLCADMYGIPVEWFLNRTHVKFKRVAQEIGIPKYQRIGSAGIQTLSVGRRPNMIRFYDKVAEYEEQLRRLKRKRSRDADEITLEREFGIPETAVITRVERQYGSQRLPTGVDCFGRLSRLPEYNPFANIEISNGTGAMVPTIQDCGLDAWLSGTRLRQIQDKMGPQQFRRWLNHNSSRNGARYLEKYSDFLHPDMDSTVTSQTIFDVYRQSVIRQLAA